MLWPQNVLGHQCDCLEQSLPSRDVALHDLSYFFITFVGVYFVQKTIEHIFKARQVTKMAVKKS